MFKDSMSEALYRGDISYDDLIKELNDARRAAENKKAEDEKKARDEKIKNAELEAARYEVIDAFMYYISILGLCDNPEEMEEDEYDALFTSIEDTFKTTEKAILQNDDKFDRLMALARMF